MLSNEEGSNYTLKTCRKYVKEKDEKRNELEMSYYYLKPLEIPCFDITLKEDLDYPYCYQYTMETDQFDESALTQISQLIKRATKITLEVNPFCICFDFSIILVSHCMMEISIIDTCYQTPTSMVNAENIIDLKERIDHCAFTIHIQCI